MVEMVFTFFFLFFFVFYNELKNTDWKNWSP